MHGFPICGLESYAPSVVIDSPKVHEFIRANGDWNEEALKVHFPVFEVVLILTISLNQGVWIGEFGNVIAKVTIQLNLGTSWRWECLIHHLIALRIILEGGGLNFGI